MLTTQLPGMKKAGDAGVFLLQNRRVGTMLDFITSSWTAQPTISKRFFRKNNPLRWGSSTRSASAAVGLVYTSMRQFW
jgi:hypothetical protein